MYIKICMSIVFTVYNTHHRGKCHCMACLRFDWFGLISARTYIFMDSNNIFSSLVKSNPVKLETSNTVILSQRECSLVCQLVYKRGRERKRKEKRVSKCKGECDDDPLSANKTNNGSHLSRLCTKKT